MKLLPIFLSLLLVAGGAAPAHAASRSTFDEPDAVTGWQIKPVFLLPADMTDTQDDTNGNISRWLDEGNAMLKSQIGVEFEIDRKLDGAYDITFVRSKRLAKEFGMRNQDLRYLLSDSKLLTNQLQNRKNYIFFVPTEWVDESFCGLGEMPGNTSIVLYGKSTCREVHSGRSNYAATRTWVHEALHNLGVDHTKEPCDLMALSDTCAYGRPFAIDASRSLYVGASLYGPDILKLPVWKGANSANLLPATEACNHIYETEDSDTFSKILCPVGARKLGTISNCWEYTSKPVLQEKVAGKWRNLAKGFGSAKPWGPSSDWECGPGDVAPSATVKVTTAKLATYRWVMFGKAEKPFTVTWVN